MVNGELLRSLREDVLKISITEASERIGINMLTYRKIEQKPEEIKFLHFDVINKLCDFYCISTDALLGRETATDIYKYNLKAIVSASYERYLFERRTTEKFKDKDFEPAWPYNLTSIIFAKEPELLSMDLNDDQYEGLMYIIRDRLTDRETKTIFGIYRDERTLADIGDEFGVGSERVRQIRERAIRKLKAPHRRDYVRYGYSAYQKTKEVEESRYNLEKTENEYDYIESQIKTVKGGTEFLKAAYNFYGLLKENATDPFQVVEDSDLKPTTIPIVSLELSVHAFNCLKRSGVNTVDDILLIASTAPNGLMSIHSIGTVTEREIIQVLRKRIGIKFELDDDDTWRPVM